MPQQKANWGKEGLFWLALAEERVLHGKEGKTKGLWGQSGIHNTKNKRGHGAELEDLKVYSLMTYYQPVSKYSNIGAYGRHFLLKEQQDAASLCPLWNRVEQSDVSWWPIPISAILPKEMMATEHNPTYWMSSPWRHHRDRAAGVNLGTQGRGFIFLEDFVFKEQRFKVEFKLYGWQGT